MRSYKPEELFDESGTLIAGVAGDGAGGAAADYGESACEWRAAAEAAGAAGLSRLCGEGEEAGADGSFVDGDAGGSFCAM